MTADCSFRMGRDHSICQDYAIARNGELTFVILADGCSSSPDTDVGARLVVRSAERLLPGWLRRACDLEGGGRPSPAAVAEYHLRAVSTAREHAVGLGLEPRSLDATLLTLVVWNGRWLALLYGDGVLAVGARSPDGPSCVGIESVAFSGGYPDYPNYLVDPGRRRAWERVPGNRRSVEAWRLSEHEVLRSDDATTGEFLEGCYVASGSTDRVEWLAVVSDGAHSFSAVDPRDRTSGRVPCTEVLRGLCAFKSCSGVFVQRRLQRFLKDCETRGWQHHDDLGVGAIAVR